MLEDRSGVLRTRVEISSRALQMLPSNKRRPQINAAPQHGWKFRGIYNNIIRKCGICVCTNKTNTGILAARRVVRPNPTNYPCIRP